MGIEYAGQISTHPIRGVLFENMVVMDVLKYHFNCGKQSNLFRSYSTKGVERRPWYEDRRDDC